MNISGVDRTFDCLGTPEGLELAAKMILRRWPHATFQSSCGQVMSFSEVPFGHIHDLFVYRDLETFLCWDVSENYNDMIEIMRSDDLRLTLVVGDDNDSMAAAVLSELGAVKLPGTPLFPLISPPDSGMVLS